MDNSDYDPIVTHTRKLKRTFDFYPNGGKSIYVDNSPFFLCGLQFRAFLYVDQDELFINAEDATPYFLKIAMDPLSMHCLAPGWNLKGVYKSVEFSYNDDGEPTETLQPLNSFAYSETTKDFCVAAFNRYVTKLELEIEVETYELKFEEVEGKKLTMKFEIGIEHRGYAQVAYPIVKSEPFFIRSIQFDAYLETDKDELRFDDDCSYKVPYSLMAKPTEEGKKLLDDLGTNWRFCGVMTVATKRSSSGVAVVEGSTRSKFEFSSRDRGFHIHSFNTPMKTVTTVIEVSLQLS